MAETWYRVCADDDGFAEALDIFRNSKVVCPDGELRKPCWEYDDCSNCRVDALLSILRVYEVEKPEDAKGPEETKQSCDGCVYQRHDGGRPKECYLCTRCEFHADYYTKDVD